MWAVAQTSERDARAKKTRAKLRFREGSLGLIYCSETKAFHMPFEAESCADPDRIEATVWPGEAWVMPFYIKPLGNPNAYLPYEEARESWPFLNRRFQNIRGGGVTAAAVATETCAFAALSIDNEDWDKIGADIGDPKVWVSSRHRNHLVDGPY